MHIFLCYYFANCHIIMPNERPPFYLQLPSEVDPAEARRIRMAIPSWETVDQSLKIRTHNDQHLRILYQRHGTVLKEYYEAQYDVVSKKGSDRLNDFVEKYGYDTLTQGPKGEFVILPKEQLERQPIFILRTHLKMIRQSLGIERKKPSLGMRKNTRETKRLAKAASKA